MQSHDFDYELYFHDPEPLFRLTEEVFSIHDNAHSLQGARYCKKRKLYDASAERRSLGKVPCHHGQGQTRVTMTGYADVPKKVQQDPSQIKGG